MTTERIDIIVNERGSAAAASNIGRIGGSSVTALAGVTALTAGLATLTVVGIAKFAANYETALIGVQKTTNLGDEAIAGLAIRFRELSTVIPKSAEELANIGQVAGQLGISNSADIVTFTETIARLASVTDFSSEAAAESLARLSNIFQLPISAVEKLGATLNELENTTTATASVLTNFIQRVSVSSRQLGLSFEDVAGVSATLVDLGFRAELAGTAVSKTFTEMVANADLFASQMGISVGQFRADLEKDAIGTVTRWAESIQDLPTDQLIKALDQVGIDGARALSVFGALITRTDLLTKNVKTANEAYADGTSLQKEFQTAVKAVNAQYQLATNRVKNLLLGIGEGLLPAISKLIGEFSAWTESMNDSEFRLRNIGAFIGGTLIDSINLGLEAFQAIRAILELIAGVALKVTGNLGLLLVPFANLTDILGLTSGATETVLANLNAMDEAGSELFKQAEKRVSTFTTGIQNANIEIDTTLKNLDKLNGAGSGGTGGAAQGSAVPVTRSARVLPFSPDELKEFRDLIESTLTPAEKLANEINRINELASRPGGFTEQQAQVAIVNALIEANDDYIDSIDGLREVLNISESTHDRYIAGLTKINQLYIDGEIDALQASNAIQNLSVSMNEGAEEVEGLAEVLRAAQDPVADLNRQLELVQQLFQEGFIDDRQASLAIRRFTDSYNSSLKRLEEDTTDTSKGIKDAIQSLANSMESRLSSALTNLIKGTADFGDFFRATIDEIIQQVLRLAVVKPFIESLFGGGSGGGSGLLGSFLTSLFAPGSSAAPSVSGNVADLPLAPSFARGGVFRIGGKGGTDQQGVRINASSDEILRINTPAQERAMRQMMSGGGNVFNIGVNISGSGQSVTEEDSRGGDFGIEVSNVIKRALVEEIRPGGLLAGLQERRT